MYHAKGPGKEQLPVLCRGDESRRQRTAVGGPVCGGRCRRELTPALSAAADRGRQPCHRRRGAAALEPPLRGAIAPDRFIHIAGTRASSSRSAPGCWASLPADACVAGRRPAADACCRSTLSARQLRNNDLIRRYVVPWHRPPTRKTAGARNHRKHGDGQAEETIRCCMH